MNRTESKYFNTAKRMDEALISLLNEKSFEYITVKEICSAAKVNRSTFYLHYENIGDLLLETIQMITQKFESSFFQQSFTIDDKSADELFLITEDWIIPYLNFIKENKLIYKAVHINNSAFNAENTYNYFFKNVFSPILLKYGISEEKHGYIMTFYRYGLSAVIMKWVENDCTEPSEYIMDIIKMFFSGQIKTREE